MKRSVLFIILLLMLMPFIFADETQDKIDKAYDCLEDRVKDKCNSLSPQEKIFSLLAIKECRDEVLDDSLDEECWPQSNCNLKLTAQAILALDGVNANIDDAKTWLISQNTTPLDMQWFLEIESSGTTTCTINYDGTSYPITINTDKKINTNAGNCLSLSQSPYTDYWLEISSNCYNKEFEISCNNSFLTTLLYKKTDSPIIYVSDKTSSASQEGTTTEKVDFACFRQGNSCDYEGSLWAAFVLDYLDEDVSSYLPYLVTESEDYPEFIPESFLYLLYPTDTNLRTILLSKQKNNKWWEESNDRYYDTALALLPFQDENPIEKTNSKNWLLDSQDSEGCFQGNIRNTAFILYSVFQESSRRSSGSNTGGTTPLTCQEVDGYCTSNTNCIDIDGSEISAYSFSCPQEEICCDAPTAQTCDDVNGYCIFETSCLDIEGNELSTYSFSCSGTKICCDTSPSSQTCSEVGGEICNADETCSVSEIETFDTYDCCTGYCDSTTTSSESECVSYGGTCRDSCLDNEKENTDECDFIGEVCCEEITGTTNGETTESKSYWWIWLLLILIILAIIGIIFRDKLRPIVIRAKSKFSKKPKTKPRPHLGRTPIRKPLTKRPLPSRTTSLKPVSKKTPSKKPKSEIDDVLKKLKDIGK